MKTALLIGSPNSGKSTIFNSLSGKFRKISNYSGITVDVGFGELKSNKESENKIVVVDLPGMNSISPNSLDEAESLLAILGHNKHLPVFHKIFVVLDWQRIESTLAFALELIAIFGKDSIALICNKCDQAKSITETEKKDLQEKVGVPIYFGAAINENCKPVDLFIREVMTLEGAACLPTSDVYVLKEALRLLPVEVAQKLKTFVKNEDYFSYIENHHKQARELIAEVFKGHQAHGQKTFAIDRYLLHPFWGTAGFFAVFYLIFYSIYTIAAPLMEGLEGLVSQLAVLSSMILPEGMLLSFINDGIIGGVGGVVVFLPQICLLFFLLSLLEQSGYISRGAFVIDRFMQLFGLNGKAFLPYLSGFACSIPAIMAARTIPSRHERMATIMTIPLVTCSARLPVYILLVGTFVPSQTVWGIFNSQALSFFFLYFLGAFFALIIAKVFRLSYYKGASDSFFIDLPIYQMPSTLSAIRYSFNKGLIFLKKAGTVILALSIVIWVLATFPKPSPQLLEGKTELEISAINLEESVIGKMGKAIEPVLSPIGMNWKIGIGLIVSLGARELFVATLGTIYALGEVDEESDTLRERLLSERDPTTGKLVFGPAVAWALLIFFVFSLQCTSTWAIVKKETGSWKYPALMFLYMGVLGYGGAFIAYRFLS